MELVDARGFSCPQPVMMTLQAMNSIREGEIQVLVDTDTSKENVIRLANSQGWNVDSVEQEGTGYKIRLSR